MICCGHTCCGRPGTWSARPTWGGSWRPRRIASTSATPGCTGRPASMPTRWPERSDLLVEMLAGGRSLDPAGDRRATRRRGRRRNERDAAHLPRHARRAGRADRQRTAAGQPAHVRAGWPSDSPAAPSPSPRIPWPSCGGGSWSVTDPPVCGTSPVGPRSTLTAARAAAARVADRLESAVVGDEEVGGTRASRPLTRQRRGEAVRLVPLYDELTLSYPAAQLPDLRRSSASSR